MPPLCQTAWWPSDLLGHPAVGVVAEGGGVELDPGFRAEDRLPLERPVPAGQVVGRRAHAPGGEGQGHVDRVGRNQAVRARLVAEGAIGVALRVPHHRAGQAGGGEQLLAQEGGVVAPTDPLDDGAQHGVPGVRVDVVAAGRKLERLAPEGGQQRRHRPALALARDHAAVAGVAGNAPRVGEQLVNGHVLARARELGQVLFHRVVDRQLARLLQPEDGRRRELLGDRADAKRGVGGGGAFPLPIGKARRPACRSADRAAPPARSH